MFRDVTTILSDKDGFKLAIDGLIEALKDVDFDLILGSESRGFIFGAPVAYAMNKDNWHITLDESYSGNCWIDIDHPQEIED